jgi:hypothetical protein
MNKTLEELGTILSGKDYKSNLPGIISQFMEQVE